MKFKLNVVVDEKPHQWVYDNIVNVFYDENGNDLLKDFLPYKADNYEKVIPFTRECNDNKKSTYLKLMEIHLGTKCNFNCKYCSQTAYRNSSYSASPKDVDPFIDLLKNNVEKIDRIQLWGGEPLVYWKTIQLLVPKLRELYPNAFITMPSNGSLLTKDKIDFYHKYNIPLFISHDGCGNEKRESEKNQDILKNPTVREALDYAHEVLGADRISINATPSSGNTNPEKIIKFFKKELWDDVKVCTHNIVRCHNSKDPQGVEFSKLSEEERKEYSDGIFEILNNTENFINDYSLVRRRQNLINTWVQHLPFDSIIAECPLPSPHGIVVNLRGDVLQCHNHPIASKTYGHLSDLSKVNALGYIHCSFKERCRNCLVVHGCCGGCPSSDDKANELACPNLYALHYAFFKSGVAALFGAYLTSVEKLEE